MIWIDQAWNSDTTETILSGFRKTKLPIKTDADGESEDSLAEEDRAPHLPPTLVELFSDTQDEEFNSDDVK